MGFVLYSPCINDSWAHFYILVLYWYHYRSILCFLQSKDTQMFFFLSYFINVLVEQTHYLYAPNLFLFLCNLLCFIIMAFVVSLTKWNLPKFTLINFILLFTGLCSIVEGFFLYFFFFFFRTNYHNEHFHMNFLIIFSSFSLA